MAAPQARPYIEVKHVGPGLWPGLAFCFYALTVPRNRLT